MCKSCCLKIICAYFLLFLPFGSISQDYGLLFRSHETPADGRTALELTTGEMCFGEKAELSIRLRFREKGKGYYGYIWRIIISPGLNIDFVCTPSPNRHKFNLFICTHPSGMSLEVDIRFDWNDIKLVLNDEKNKIDL